MGRELSVMLAVLPGGRAPTREEASARLSPYYAFVPGPDDPEGPGKREGEPDDAPEWRQGWRGPEGDEHLLSVGAFEAAWIDVPLRVARLGRGPAAAVRKARWALWCTTRLDARDPLAAFARQLRFVSIAAPDAVVVHDFAKQVVCDPARLRALSSWATPPPPTELFQVHAVSPPRRAQKGWVHTHGLERAGMPDVEVLLVPLDLARPAFDLVSAFVRARLGTRVPVRGSTDDLVLGHRVSWLPYEEAIARLPAGEIGGRDDRRIAPSHAGRRIVLVDDPREGRPPLPPLDVLLAFEDASAVVRVRPSESERAARLARERWPVFQGLFASHGDDLRWSFAVCVPEPTAAGGHEFLWWIVEEVRGTSVRCRVRNEVLDVPGLSTGDERWHDVSRLEDWVVYAPKKDVTPATTALPA
jgi:hypothetical protein